MPQVDEVIAYIDHYGFFEGEYRVFNIFSIRRQWVLQRLNQGPWRIAEVHSL